MQQIDADQLSTPILVLIRGLPGSGKSHLATALRAALGDDITVSLDPDAVDQNSEAYQKHVAEQTAEGVDPKLHLYRYSRGMAFAGIRDHKIIIWSQPFTNLEVFKTMSDKLVAYAEETGSALPVLVVEVAIDPATASKRVEQRKQAGGHGPSTGTFDRFVREYTTAGASYNIVAVQGDADVSTSVSAVLEHIGNLLN